MKDINPICFIYSNFLRVIECKLYAHKEWMDQSEEESRYELIMKSKVSSRTTQSSDG